MDHRLQPLFGKAPDTWRAANAALFPTDESLRWTLRQHRERLVRSGALVRLRGAWHAVEPAFSAEVVAIARDAAHAAIADPA